MTTITLENVDNIISYLKPKERMIINSKYREETIKESKEKIRRITTKWLLSYSKEMDNNYYHVPITVYKKFYPLKYRGAFIEKVLDNLAGNIKYGIVCDIIEEYDSLVDQFNHIVEILNEEQLFHLGW
jgi:hypothetical protein